MCVVKFAGESQATLLQAFDSEGRCWGDNGRERGQVAQTGHSMNTGNNSLWQEKIVFYPIANWPAS